MELSFKYDFVPVIINHNRRVGLIAHLPAPAIQALRVSRPNLALIGLVEVNNSAIGALQWTAGFKDHQIFPVIEETA